VSRIRSVSTVNSLGDLTIPRPRHARARREAADALARVAPLASRWIERLLASDDPPLTVTQYLALRAIADGDVVGAELARRAGVSPAAVSQLLSALAAAGLVERQPGSSDRRRQPLSLGPRGRETLASASAQLQRGLADLIEDLSPPEVDALVRLEHALTGTAPPPRPKPPRPH
jgi:DNA-binding MarR family transcriptional regulator